MESPSTNIDALQREYFGILDTFFKRATGQSYNEFAAIHDFAVSVRENRQLATQAGHQAFIWVYQELQKFYARNSIEMFRASRSTGGMKLVLGGSRFTVTHFNAVRKMLLYTDTILIPDPVMPWIENPRSEEKFRHVLFLENIFILLHLKPLVDAKLPYPAIIVFPSFEKYLEENDAETKEGISTLVRQFVSHHTQIEFSSSDELRQYVTTHEANFLSLVDKKKLFIAPGGHTNEPLDIALKKYRSEMETWRSEDFVSQAKAMPDGIFVLYALYERLGPQYHLLENADELNSQPMHCIPAMWHYYSLCTEMYSERLTANSILDAGTVMTLRSLNEPNLQWLGNVPINALVRLRENNENEDFRKSIETYTKQLHSASADDLNRTAAEVGRGIASLLVNHQKRIREIEDRYTLLHTQTAIGAWVTFAATIVPALAPFSGSVALLPVVTKYGWEKAKEVHERKNAARSLTGILAAAKDS